MDFYDKICFLIKKLQTMKEAYVDVKTTNGCFCLFCTSFTKKKCNIHSDNLLCSRQTGPPNLEDNENHDSRNVDE